MNVGKSTMDRWARELKSECNGTASYPRTITPEQRKTQELEKQIKRIKLEKEILKTPQGHHVSF